MSKRITIIFLLSLILQASLAQVIWDRNHLAQVKQHIHEPFYSQVYQSLMGQADQLLHAEPLSVMMKTKIPASGNKHDYMSLARYYWPDPNRQDGHPYISRDGQSNPELNDLDRNRLGTTATRVTTLSLAWYLSGDERYAQKAVDLLKVWFLNKSTAMNPNLEYAQMVPGRNGNKGRSSGVLDTYSFVSMLDAVYLLEKSSAFTRHDSQRLRYWFGQLLQWMLHSPQGIGESNAKNNHAIAYDAQIVSFALYAGKKKVAQQVLQHFPERSLFTQIEPDGRMPQELRRTLAFGYSQYNLTHMIDLFLMGRHIGLELSHSTSKDGRSFYKAMDFLSSYVGKQVEDWPYQQISEWDYKQQEFCKDLYRTALYLDSTRTDYLRLFRQYRHLDMSDPFFLLYYQPSVTDMAMAHAMGQLRLAIKCTNQARNDSANSLRHRITPRSLNHDGTLALVSARDWCSGFFAGSLWQMYAYTHDDFWRQQAISFTWPIEEAKWLRSTHDLGFMIGDCFGKAYELTGERSYRDVVVQASKSLITRFNRTVGCLRSWDHNRDRWQFPVIIDNMMNLEMLFRATQITGDSTFWHIAVSHANTTLRHHFRPDFSSYHVVDYDTITGAVRMRCTAQGYNDESYWSRGQAWGLYGYTMCYRYTHDVRYLEQARHIAHFIMSLPLPKDGIPYWDMKSSDIPHTSRDASAAAIATSALFELANYLPTKEASSCLSFAKRTLDSLYQHYRAPEGSNCGFILLHSTGHHPAGSEIDVPICYADYYYLEALNRFLQR